MAGDIYWNKYGRKRLIKIQVLNKIVWKPHKRNLQSWSLMSEEPAGWQLTQNLKLEARPVIALDKTSEVTTVPAEDQTGIVALS